MAHDKTSRKTAVVLAASLVATLGAFGLTSVRAQNQQGVRPKPKPTPAAARTGGEMKAPSWKAVDRLIEEQKMEEASKEVSRLRLQARQAENEPEWTKALIREVQLRTALHGYETAVRFLREEPWPKGSLSRATLQLFYGHSLVTYQQAYSWEIGKREKVDTKGVVDLKAWTRDEIWAEAEKAYAEVWKEREALGKEPVKRLAEYMDANTYPENVRGTLRDAATYLFVELLANTQGWSAEQQNEVYRLDLAAPLAGDPSRSGAIALTDRSVHPLVKIGALLDDLEAWHEDGSAAQLEARLERSRRLRASFTDEDDLERIRKHLETLLPAYRGDSWWAMGMGELAEIVVTQGNLVRARQLAKQGAEAYPGTPGAQKCASIVASIEAPAYQLAAMSTDANGKRSFEVTHKNLDEIFFRAYPFDLEKRLKSARDYNLLPNGNELEELLKNAKPVAEWRTALPKTPDFKLHRTFVTPAIEKKGFYVVVASVLRSFAQSPNQLNATFFLASDLVLLTRAETDGDLEVFTVAGGSGKAVAGADVSLWRYDWQEGHSEVARKATNAEGLLTFPFAEERTRNQHFVLARKGDDLALDPRYLAFWRQPVPGTVTNSLVYTDRSIYRPQQKLFFKVVGYRGSSKDAKYQTLPNTAVTITLLDANYQKVDSVLLQTNAFGSAAGELNIPTGRLLGQWQIQSSLGGNAAFRVEEYKRPTFEAELKEPKEALRLNRPATLRGEARYYFGLPVTNGTVKWRVSREAVYPWWWDSWWWGGMGPSTKSQIVASGTSNLREDGSFELAFTPRAKELGGGKPDAQKGVTYRYSVSADVTDEGGETRSASRGFRLGFVAVEARLAVPASFLLETDATDIKVTRTDLDGAPRAGKGSWKLVKLEQPQRTLTPAEQPLAARPVRDGDIQTPGDTLRPRWDVSATWDRILREWKDGAVVASGATSHDAKGEATIALAKLPAGAYRLRYETADDFGAAYDTFQNILVAGKSIPLSVPLAFVAESGSVKVGGTARFLVKSGLVDQPLVLDLYRNGQLLTRRFLNSGKDETLVEIPVTEKDRGGFGATLTAVRDHQHMTSTASVFVPWDDKELDIAFSSFRDKMRPGAKETWTVTLKGPKGARVDSAAAELLAYMYDKSLDSFGPHSFPSAASLYPWRTGAGSFRANLGTAQIAWLNSSGLGHALSGPSFRGDVLKFYSGYGIGGPGVRSMAGGARLSKSMARQAPAAEAMMDQAAPAPASAPAPQVAGALGAAKEKKDGGLREEESDARKNETGRADGGKPEAPQEVRSNFAETAFFLPQLRTDADGVARLEFTVPDSVTAWNVWVHGLTKDLSGGSLKKEAKSVKELMVRPYVPRFLREGDEAELKVVVNNASEKDLPGRLTLEVFDPETNTSLAGDFGLRPEALSQSFTVKAGGGTNLSFRLTAPKKVGLAAFRITARSGDFSDGELRPVPILPSRMHLVQSRFVTLRNKDRKVLKFDDLAKDDDPSRIDEQMVVTVDAQLFYTVLQSLPYLVNYPYECTEQTLNRFVSTGIVSSMYKDYPAIAKMATEMSKRTTPLETWDSVDPNRKLQLEESPWVQSSKGGTDAGHGLSNVLDPRVARADRDASLAKLRKAQTASGGFPWWAGGPPSPYMTLYIMHGFAKAIEFGVDVPKDMVQAGWRYLGQHYQGELQRMMADDCCWEFLAFLNYVASCYPDESWTNGALPMDERTKILNFCFKHWKQHSPYLKGYLSLTLKRMNREKDARLVWESVMDSAKSNEEQGTFWAQEDRSWLWYNDTIESHAFALRTVMELTPEEPKKDGLVQWILLNKKLNQWKSTRATAEVIYSLLHYLKKEGALGIREDATVTIGSQKVQFVFEPDSYTGKKNQIVVPGDKIDPRTSSTVVVEKESKGFAFASATWHFSTEKLPAEDRGDFFNVSRTYFKRENDGKQWTLKPLADGAKLEPGDQIEVHLSLRTKHAAEYVHLRDPRAAGLEPENAVSRYKWDLGIGWYEEIRDSGTNFFFEWLPQGEYAFKYRLRANMAGTFRIGPATVQSMYAPEFTAYSTGYVMKISPK